MSIKQYKRIWVTKISLKQFRMLRDLGYIVLFASLFTACGPKSKWANTSLETHGFAGGDDRIYGTLFKLETDERKNFIFHQGAETSITIRIDENLDTNIVGLATMWEGRCNIDLRPELFYNTNKLRVVVLHELAHCFGMHHDPRPENIMYMYTDTRQYTNTAYDTFVEELSIFIGD